MDSILDIEDRLELGMIPGSPMSDSYSVRWDHREDPPPPTDLGWIGEDHDGIWMSYHPLTALIMHETLWDIVAEFQLGQTETTAQDLAQKSSLEYMAKIEMSTALQRSQTASIKSRSRDDQS